MSSNHKVYAPFHFLEQYNKEWAKHSNKSELESWDITLEEINRGRIICSQKTKELVHQKIKSLRDAAD